jgi:hypothetical protein
VRYRIESPPVFGTLLALLISDLEHGTGDSSDIHGYFNPDLGGDEWKKLIKSGFHDDLHKLADLNRTGEGHLDPKWIEEFISVVSNEQHLSTGDRLVIFGEVVDHPDECTEWDTAMEVLLRRLPERFGFVILGAPDDCPFPAEDPHFLEIDWRDTVDSSAAETAYSYKVAWLQDDQPAAEDLLDVQSYAAGIARLILHPQTNPLTIGIQAPWGKGKSSFMRFIDRELVRWAPANRETLIPKLERTEDKIRTVGKKIAEEEIVREGEGGGTGGDTAGEMEALLSEERELHEEYRRLWQKMRLNALNDVVSVHFNAWQYEDAKQIWAGLASRVSGAMEKAVPFFVRGFIPLSYAWRQHRSAFIFKVIVPVVGAVLIALALLYGYWPELTDLLHESIANNELPEFLTLSKIFVPVGSSCFLLWFTAWRVFSVVQPVSERVLKYIHLPDYREQMGFQHRVLSDLQFMYAHLKKWKGNPRVVVFIDDLDRCSEDKIIEMLQAVNLILGASDFFVLLGIDTEMLYRAIRSYYTKDGGDKTLPDNFPENYLCKVIQLAFHIPEFPADSRFSLVRNLFSPETRKQYEWQGMERKTGAGSTQRPSGEMSGGSLGFNLELARNLSVQDLRPVEDTVEELKAFDDYKEFLVDNPREVKRLVNVHRLVKILLQLRDPNISWPEEKQRRLIVWLTFCALWPDLIDDVLRFAKANKNSMNCIRDMVDRAQGEVDDTLERFAIPKKDGDAISAEDLKAGGHYHLAAYFSHLIREEESLRVSCEDERTPGNEEPDDAAAD